MILNRGVFIIKIWKILKAVLTIVGSVKVSNVGYVLMDQITVKILWFACVNAQAQSNIFIISA